MAWGHKCPNCATRCGVRRALWGLGKAFPCTGCGASLVYDKEIAVPLMAVAGYWMLKPKGPDARFMDELIALVPFLVGVLLYTMFVMAPRRAGQ